jgi:hypothetical protein
MQLINDLCNYLIRTLDENPIKADIDTASVEGTSSAGTNREEIFTRDYLCPSMREYFRVEARSMLNLADDEIDKGLGTEGFTKCDGYSFTPAKMTRHILGKGDLAEPMPPSDWLKSGPDKLRNYQPCPDFAFHDPLPRVVGEVKYFMGGSQDKALRDFYTVVKEAVFYLGVFNGVYDAALIVVADASEDSAMHKILDIIKPELLARFGDDSGIYLSIVRI